MQKNAIYAQSGGVTSVINASACGVISAFRDLSGGYGKLYAAENGILGVLHEELIDTSYEDSSSILKLRYTPGGAFGSCRYKLKSLEKNRKEYQRLIEVFKAHNIEYFFYNGGNDSADTCLKVSQIATELNYPIKAIHIPKTIDNDLVVTDNCPGFGSVAKYVVTSVIEAGMDLASMCKTSTQVFVLEVMGRHTGWIAASSGIASQELGNPPHIILFPERAFDAARFLNKVAATVKQYGYCVIVAAEGIQDSSGGLISSSGVCDAFGHTQLGGVAASLVGMISSNLKLKCHYAIADYLQRSARHISSKVDVEQAYQLGYTAVKLAVEDNKNAVMPYIKRISNNPYQWQIEYVDLISVANKEKFMPRNFIDEEGFHITQQCVDYIKPLINGEDYPQYIDGIPEYVRLKNIKINKKLAEFLL